MNQVLLPAPHYRLMAVNTCIKQLNLNQFNELSHIIRRFGAF
jgi:hypothetical protein